MRQLIALVLVLFAARAEAQVRPGNFSTLNTTSTTADSLHVGCAVGSSSCTGGIKAGTIAATTATITTMLALLSDTAFGAHSISSAGATVNSLTVQNTTSGMTAFGRIVVSGGTTALNLDALSQGFSTSGSAIAASARIYTDATGGLTLLASNAAGILRFETGGENLRWGVNTAGDFTFGASSNIAFSSGSPSIASGFGGTATISGNDYAFLVTSSGNNTTGTVTFGHTWTNAPACVITPNSTGTGVFSSGASTTQLVIANLNSVTAVWNVHCAGS